ncbi:DUF1214 domain-containing protein [Echinicola salinicaeni]|uniref:DUF1214 domain-containing protein n=1 Tax=Echinicola salinicaeni TaxID=2762757 RepID=UPI001647F735|nr:DUF1214 domain-containing protein [Echinicola salinicaeni]
MKTLRYHIMFLLFFLLLIWQCKAPSNEKEIAVDENGYAILSDDQVENLVKRSYQYVAMYNVNNKFAQSQGGYNTIQADKKPKDHTLKDIARPNNDTFYTAAMLDLRNEPMIINIPAINSDYVSLMVTAYDHHVNVPKSTRKGDFKKPEKLLLYSENTQAYNGEQIEGIDDIFKTSGDFVSAVFRIMPHLNEPERFAEISTSIDGISIETLSEFENKSAKPEVPLEFPPVGKTNIETFKNNLLEVIQFVMNHVELEPTDEDDQKLLEAYQPLGIAPGNEYKEETAIKVNGDKFAEIAKKYFDENLAKIQDEDLAKILRPNMFQPKGLSNLETLLLVSIVGPIGLPMEEAMYPAINAADGTDLNAMNDYVISMNKEELPPAEAFWSVTLYDEANGFFIPNDHKKYSVGKNSGFKLNDEGGIEIYVSAQKPTGVPEENWLPINREDLDLSLILRIYVPDLDKLETWKAPVALRINN